MFKKEMTAEELEARKAKKAARKEKREQRAEKFKDGLAEVGGAMLPIVLPILAVCGASIVGSVSSAKKSKEQKLEAEEYQNLLAIGKGFTGRKDPNWIAYQYDMDHSVEEEKVVDVDSEEE